jgi:hypothetical protein
MYGWRDAGIEACNGVSGCTALIWDDPDKAPAIPPLNQADLSEAQAASMVAIWIHDSAQLVLVRRVEK